MIDTELTRRFGLIFPIIGHPEPWTATGHLAAEVSKAGALGMIGAGPCDRDWIKAQFDAAEDNSVGCGLYCNRLELEPEMLDFVLSLHPRAIYLSDGDPRPYAETIRKHRCRLICQTRSMDEIDNILEAGAEIVVIRGNGEDRSNSAETTFSLVPEASDYLYSRDDEVILVASGGVMDARGMAAMITLGADGVCIGRRIWATQESPLSGKTLVQELGPHTTFAEHVLPVQSLLRTMGSKAERILSHMPRKIIKEPPGPGAIGELGQDFVLQDQSKPRPGEDQNDR